MAQSIEEYPVVKAQKRKQYPRLLLSVYTVTGTPTLTPQERKDLEKIIETYLLSCAFHSIDVQFEK